MLKTLGIETRLQLAITICVVTLVLVTPLGGGGGAAPVFFTYQSLLLVITILCAIGSRRHTTVGAVYDRAVIDRAYSLRISPLFLALFAATAVLALLSLLRVQSSHFAGLYLWYQRTFFISAFLALALYSRYQSARWKGIVLGTVVACNIAHLLPDLVMNHRPVAGFSLNPNYFGTFMLVGLAASLAMAVFGTTLVWRVAAAGIGALLLFGIVQTASRGAALAVAGIAVVAAVRAGSRIPRYVWLAAGLLGLIVIVISSPLLVQKFVDRGETDPYNYARTLVWKSALQVTAQHPLLGIGLGEYFHVSKRFAFPVEGVVARYLKRAQIAHSEYLQYAAETGIPATLLLFSLLGYLAALAWKRADAAGPEYRCFHEAAILTFAGLGVHGLVDNCWTIPVTASGLVVIALADLLPVQKRKALANWNMLRVAPAGVALAVLYVYSTAIPALGSYYNEAGHHAYDNLDFTNAERYHLAAVAVMPNQPVFLDNLGMVYLRQFTDTKEPRMLELAEKYFARAIASAPQALDPRIHMETVWVRSLTGNREQDREIHKRIIENNTQLLVVDPFVPFARKNLAEALYHLGESERALQELKKAIEYEPNYVPAYLQLASWYRELGNTAESDRCTAAAVAVVLKYRNFKPNEPYEGLLLARPEASWNHS